MVWSFFCECHLKIILWLVEIFQQPIRSFHCTVFVAYFLLLTLAAKRITPHGPENYIFARLPFWLRSACHLFGKMSESIQLRHVPTEFLYWLDALTERTRQSEENWLMIMPTATFRQQRHWLPRATLRQRCNFHLISVILYFVVVFVNVASVCRIGRFRRGKWHLAITTGTLRFY